MEIDKKTRELLMQALAEIQADIDIERIKREKKLYADINFPIHLKEILYTLTKDELNNIRHTLQINKISHLKKQDLAVKLTELIPKKAAEIFGSFDTKRYKLAKKIADNGGLLFVKKVSTDHIEYFRSRGIIFSGTFEGKKALVMPLEIVEEFKKINTSSYKAKVNNNTLLLTIAKGLLYYYGTIDIFKMIELLKKYSPEKVHELNLISLIFDAKDYIEEITFHPGYFAYYKVLDIDKIIEEQSMRPDVDYYPFTTEQLLQAGKPNFLEPNNAYLDLVDFIYINFIISYKKAKALVSDCVFLNKNGALVSELLHYLQDCLEIDSDDIIEKLLINLSILNNTTRQWFLKGYTPEELYEEEKKLLQPLHKKSADIIDFLTGKKIGRNDPCPCGSGKKFKKCCGK